MKSVTAVNVDLTSSLSIDKLFFVKLTLSAIETCKIFFSMVSTSEIGQEKFPFNLLVTRNS